MFFYRKKCKKYFPNQNDARINNVIDRFFEHTRTYKNNNDNDNNNYQIIATWARICSVEHEPIERKKPKK